MHAWIRIYVSVYVCMYVCTYVCMYVFIYIYLYIYTYTYRHSTVRYCHDAYAMPCPRASRSTHGQPDSLPQLEALFFTLNPKP